MVHQHRDKCTCTFNVLFLILLLLITGLNDGQSVQVAVIRNEKETVLHVNNRNSSVPDSVLLLNTYSNKPWINPEKGETVALNNKLLRNCGICMAINNIHFS